MDCIEQKIFRLNRGLPNECSIADGFQWCLGSSTCRECLWRQTRVSIGRPIAEYRGTVLTSPRATDTGSRVMLSCGRCLPPVTGNSMLEQTNQPCIDRSMRGKNWHELRGFKELESMIHWESPEDPSSARVRSLESVPSRPDRIVAGVEVGGVHVSNDGGETWVQPS